VVQEQQCSTNIRREDFKVVSNPASTLVEAGFFIKSQAVMSANQVLEQSVVVFSRITDRKHQFTQPIFYRTVLARTAFPT
jgi:hypothetical protein